MSLPYAATTPIPPFLLFHVLVPIMILLLTHIAIALTFYLIDSLRSQKSVSERWSYKSLGLISHHKTGGSVLLLERTIAGNKTGTSGTLHMLTKSTEYLRNVVLENDIFECIYSECVNKHKLCSFWESIDMCTQNPNYMVKDKIFTLACQQCG